MLSTSVGVVDFPTLGDLADGWIAQHCRIPRGALRGRAFVPYDWQFWCRANRLRIREGAVYDPENPPLNQAFVYRRSLIVGIVSLIAHMVDFFGTLRVCPDLSFEANPIWCVVVDKMGLVLARWYGFTGKVLLAVIGFEFFAYYLIQREKLIPDKVRGFFSFWNNFGMKQDSKKIIRFANIKNFFAFLFALVGPFCLYIALLNSITDSELYMRMPSMPLMLLLYIIILTLVYLFGNYWAAKRNG